MMKWRSVGARVLLATMAVSMLAAASRPRVGKPAPNFELTLIDGSKVTLDQLRGNVIVLNFWATWCGPCKRELPTLDAYYSVQSAHGLKVFAIATEDSLPLSMLKKLFAAMHMPSVRRMKGSYDTLGGVPTNYVIDRAGTIRYAKAGAFDLDTLNEILVPLLNEQPPASPSARPIRAGTDEPTGSCLRDCLSRSDQSRGFR